LLQVTEKHNQYKLYREEYEAARKVWQSVAAETFEEKQQLLTFTITLDSILFAKHAASHFMQAEEEKFIKAMRREMVPIARPMPQFPPPFVPQRYWTITLEVLNPKS
jgi:hypothetical protein